jgi:hypothetical protein
MQDPGPVESPLRLAYRLTVPGRRNTAAPDPAGEARCGAAAGTA